MNFKVRDIFINNLIKLIKFLSTKGVALVEVYQYLIVQIYSPSKPGA